MDNSLKMNNILKTNSKAKKILIIEDDDILSSTLADNLAYDGFEVVQAKDGLARTNDPITIRDTHFIQMVNNGKPCGVWEVQSK